MVSRPLKFKVLSEDWQHYRLDDDSIIRIKALLSRVVDTGQEDPEKGVLLDFEFTNIVKVDTATGQPDQSNRPNREHQTESISFELLEESVQVYYLYEMRQILLVKPTIKTIKPTSQRDERGFPIFDIESRVGVIPVQLPPD